MRFENTVVGVFAKFHVSWGGEGGGVLMSVCIVKNVYARVWPFGPSKGGGLIFIIINFSLFYFGLANKRA